VLRFDHGAMVSVRSTGRDIVQTQVFQLESNSLGGTDLQFRLTRTPTGLGRFLTPFRDDEVEKGMKRQMRKLKKLVEKHEQSIGARVVSEQRNDVTSETPTSEAEGAIDSTDKARPAGRVVEGKSGPTDIERESNRKRDFLKLFGTG